MRDVVWPQPVLDLLTRDPERPVFEDGDRVVRAGEASAAVARIAAGLRAAGAGPGTGVALDLGVSAEALAATLAAFAVGARVCGLPPALPPTQRDDLLARADVALVVDDAFLAELLATPADGPVVAAGRPGDVARVTWTSGTSGRPKGCVQTYAAMTAAWAPSPDRWPPAVAALAPRLARYLVVGPLSHQVVLEYAVLTLAAGGVLVAARPPGFPEAITRHRASASVITVGRLHQLVRAQLERPTDLSTLRALLVSGSPLEPARLAEALDVLGPVVFHGYGQTEAGMIAMATPDEMLADPAVTASVGRAPDVVDVQVRDGELWVRTPAQASGYWGDPQETAEVFVDGWVRTRDLGDVDDRGYVHLRGRARDVVIVDAQLVHAGPVERVLADDPAVAEAYVVARPDDVTGEAVHAFVVPAHGAEPDTAALCARVADRLGPLAVPSSVTLVDEVPLAPSGKPDKAALVARATV
ncbi:AMP-dependent synthetase and ligase [Cellulomonas flavigena DSM 20109]|uniref:AMP-dependent synthetase and ligase n=1 Tax=Cellulomonas flavigena (strain ATCC 482 / DSM 20109 / BCRC 11376 / JCM 18109 / NBRC 3775 / NCIMB 8073 / NRS 134) TaxID=446466 RepID=D5UFZ8_CELFN|nr:fatty acid--CoA ligase family protein [Cellulomonas flavigena]ADG75021.1 AMP-dependent synthetase and ligase [Cellulomonas flavigena DSM 20109]